jgi:pimeloyl-ACP methyl ester carboxylesterase
MSFVSNQGARIYWEEHGAGEPVLMIMGLSYTLDMWYRLRPAVSARYRTILFDNRGIGRSDTPPGPYLMRQMADDAKAVLDAAGVESAYVMGASMGGMIAQELTLRHPGRVRALLLGCSGPGGLRSKLPHFKRLQVSKGGPGSREEREWALAPMLYSDATPKERIAEDIEIRLRYPPTPAGFLSQFAAIVMWSSYSRLPRINVPTLVIHGDEDRMVPLANGKLLAERIPDSRFHLIRGAGHIITTDQPDVVDREVLRFLDEQSSRMPT